MFQPFHQPITAETIKNKQISEIYKERLDVLYTEPGSTAVLGSFLKHHDTINATKTLVKIKANGKRTISSDSNDLKEIRKKADTSTSGKCKDIRTFFQNKKSDAPTLSKISAEKSIVEID